MLDMTCSNIPTEVSTTFGIGNPASQTSTGRAPCSISTVREGLDNPSIQAWRKPPGDDQHKGQARICAAGGERRYLIRRGRQSIRYLSAGAAVSGDLMSHEQPVEGLTFAVGLLGRVV